MTRLIHNPIIRTTVTITCVLLLPRMSSVALAQSYAQGYQQAASQNLAPQLLAPDQLDNLVAPIALYPDPLLSQVLAASTYPLEIVEAQQWLQQNRSLQGPQLIEAAKQQNWDPSIQVLVAFPDAMALLSRDVRWTTDLGNAFLAQQADVMNAIQEMRARASNNGRLANTPQQIVTTETQGEQSAIQIQPANPQVIYPPVYDPAYVWGPPASGYYPAASYPQGDYGYGADYGSGSGFGSGVNIGGLFSGLLSAAGTIGGLLGTGGLGGLGGWGWILNWFTHTLSLNGLFFNGLGFHNSGGGFNSSGNYSGPAIWAHNPAHRRGVPYSSGFTAARYRAAESSAGFSSRRSSSSGFGASSSAASSFAGSSRTAFAAPLRTDGTAPEAAVPRSLLRCRRRTGDSSRAAVWAETMTAAGCQTTAQISHPTSMQLRSGWHPISKAPHRSDEPRRRRLTSRSRGCRPRISHRTLRGPRNMSPRRRCRPRISQPRISLRHTDLPTPPRRTTRAGADTRARATTNTKPALPQCQRDADVYANNLAGYH